jgi:hypothetical protein
MVDDIRIFKISNSNTSCNPKSGVIVWKFVAETLNDLECVGK